MNPHPAPPGKEQRPIGSFTLRHFFAVAVLAAWSIVGQASNEYYYKNMLIGERAFGMGGAFTAIADDPSGIYHNPAGIAFSLENYLSLSANAFMSSEQRFKEVYPGQDYVYSSGGFVPSFFGFIQDFGRHKVGFAIVVPHTDNIDQSDAIAREASGTLEAKAIERKFLKQETAYQVGPAFATELTDQLSIGVSMMGYLRISRLIDNTLVKFEPVGTGPYFWQMVSMNQTSFAVLPKLGIQYMPSPKFSVGLTLEKPFNVAGSGTLKATQTRLDANADPQPKNGNTDNDLGWVEGSVFSALPSSLAASLGVAYFLSRSWLFTAQLDMYTGESSYEDYPIRAVINWALGGEYYLNESFAFRLGVYSNNSKTNPVSATGEDQRPHVDLMGLTASASLYRSGTSLTLGTSYSFGKGQGQAFESTPIVHEVEQKHLAIYLAGSYQL